MAWKVGAAKNLPISTSSDNWDGAKARASLFGTGDTIDQESARRGHLIYDDDAPQNKGSYKLPFAMKVGGELQAIPSGLRASASRLPQTDIPASVEEEARAVLDGYFAKMNQTVVTQAFYDRRRPDGRLGLFAILNNAKPDILARLGGSLEMVFQEGRLLVGYFVL